MTTPSVGGIARTVRGIASAAVTIVLLATSTGQCCDTPVYRYAMYRWKPQAYEIYAFHRKAIDGEAAKVRAAVNQLIDGKKNPANLAYIAVDVSADPQLKSIPEQVRAQYKAAARKEKTDPVYIVYSPMGRHLYSGALTTKDVQWLAQSKGRDQLAAQLASGKTGVLVLLTCKDKKLNQSARDTIAALRTSVRSGKISLVPADSRTDEEKKKKKAVTSPAKEFGLIEVNRNDPKEAWFVKSLVGIEGDLAALDKPMVFTVYGRARAMPPCIDKGITENNLARDLTFIAGACSCTIKEQNPGVDLLVRFNWDKAAAAIAEKFGSEEGNEKQIASEEFFPDLLIPGTENKDDKKGKPSTLVAAKKQGSQGGPQSKDANQVAANDKNADEIKKKGAGKPADPDSQAPPKNSDNKVASAGQTSLPKQEAAPEEPTFLGFWVILAGLGVGLVVLFGATFLVLRPR